MAVGVCWNGGWDGSMVLGLEGLTIYRFTFLICTHHALLLVTDHVPARTKRPSPNLLPSTSNHPPIPPLPQVAHCMATGSELEATIGLLRGKEAELQGVEGALVEARNSLERSEAVVAQQV